MLGQGRSAPVCSVCFLRWACRMLAMGTRCGNSIFGPLSNQAPPEEGDGAEHSEHQFATSPL